MTTAQLLTIVLFSLAVFAAASFLTRAPGRRVVAAFAGGIAASAVGCALDVLGTRLGCWYYTTAGGTHAPWLVYLGVVFLQGAVALIGWRIATRFGGGIVALYVAAVAAGFTAQDVFFAGRPNPTQVMTAGFGSVIFDFVLWSIVTTAGLALLNFLTRNPLQESAA